MKLLYKESNNLNVCWKTIHLGDISVKLIYEGQGKAVFLNLLNIFLKLIIFQRESIFSYRISSYINWLDE